jgi:hypothetical protein
MTAAAPAYPHSQHWRVDGFRITVLPYKSHRNRMCRTCGRRGAVHCVWADRADGFHGRVADFCDAHHPAKGSCRISSTSASPATAPPTSAVPSGTTSPSHPSASRPTRRVRAPPADSLSAVRCELRCAHCTDPAQYTVSTVRRLTIDAAGTAERTIMSIGHDPHTISQAYACEDHRP